MNEELRNALNAFQEDQSKENKVKMVNAMLKTTMFLPGIFPPGIDPEKIPKPKPGERIQLPKEMQPLPAILKNKDGEAFLPAYTSQEGLPKDPKPQVVLNLPFMAIVNMAVRNPNVQGIAVNPFEHNVILKEPLLEAILEDDRKRRAAAPPQNLQQMNPAQAKAFFRRRVETALMPQEFFADPKAFTEALCEEAEAFVRKQYEKVYKNPADCPYPTSEMSVMALNIREGLLLVRVDLPSPQKEFQCAVRSYVLYAEESGRAEYFTVERAAGKEFYSIGRVRKDGVYEEIGEAPAASAELQRMLDLYDHYGNEGN